MSVYQIMGINENNCISFLVAPSVTVLKGLAYAVIHLQQ